MDDDEVRNLIAKTLRLYSASLNPDCKAAARADIPPRGGDPLLACSDGLAETVQTSNKSAPGISRVQEAIEVIPNEEKAAFAEACCYCPALVHQESHPRNFLERYDYNVLKAAQGIVQYWSVRREIFGDRAFLPLNLTGKGALDEEDVNAMRSGFLMILPPDKLGRQVLFTDFSRLRSISDGTLLRTTFFLRSLLSCNKDASKIGYVGIQIYNKELKSILERPVSTTLHKMLEKAMPTFTKMTYVVTHQRSTLSRLLKSSPDLAEGMLKQATPLFANTMDQLREKLRKHHFELSGIPDLLGGSWNLHNFQSWLRAQESLKSDMSSTSGTPLPCHLGSLANIGDQLQLNVEVCVRDVMEALELIPVEKKKEYLEAMATCPFLVRTESNPIHFLRCESGDSVAAARRVVRYWELRKTLFRERAFKPLTFQKGGVFSDTERERLKSFLAVRVLPCDKRGRPVVWWDPSYAKGRQLTKEEKWKYWFYMYSILAEQTGAQEEGVVSIAVPNTTMAKSSGFQLSFNKLRETMLQSFPLKTWEIRCFTVSGSANVEFLSLILNAIPRSAQAYVAQSRDEVCEELVSFGLSRQGIPVEWGGLWGPNEDRSWRQVRDNLEENRIAAGVFQPVTDAVLPKPSDTVQEKLASLRTNFEEIMNEAILSLPQNEKDVLSHALISCPDLVKSESDPWKYVHLEQGNLLQAARRIARYWTLRKEIFGDAAFFPSGSNFYPVGSVAGRKTETSSLDLLPGLDYHGRHIMFADNVADFTSLSWRRKAFSVLSRMVKQSEESEIVLIFRTVDHVAVSRNLRVTIDLMNNAFPLKLSRLFVCFVRGTEAKSLSTCETSLLQLELQRDMGEGLAGSTSVQFAVDNNELIERLDQVHGVSRRSLSFLISANEDIDTDTNGVSGCLEESKLLEEPKEQKTDRRSIEETPLFECADKHTDMSKSPQRNSDGTATCAEKTNISQSASSVSLLSPMEQVLQHIPAEERCHYDNARSKVPKLVENESGPNLFLKFENNNLESAVKRLTRYWKQRVEVFKERALRPLNQTGEGALSKVDVMNVRSGYLAPLPNDSDGRSVLLHDCSRLVKRDIPIEKRNLFYWSLVLAQNEVSVERGVVLLIMLDGKTISPQIRRLFDITRQCFPFKIHSVHIVCRDQGKGIPASVAQSISLLPGAEKTQIHAYSAASPLAELRSNGFDLDGLPESLGGHWSYEKFSIWQEHRMRLEWNLPGGATEGEEANYKVKPYSELTETERAERKRRLNVLHSRRKRQRERIERGTLQEQVDRLQAEQKYLLVEKARLESLVRDAKQLTGSL